MEDAQLSPKDRAEIDQAKLETEYLKEQLKKLQEKEPAWERILKSSVTGVLIGAFLSLSTNYIVERSRALEHARDAETQRIQATIQIIDDLAAPIYAYWTRASLFAEYIIYGPIGGAELDLRKQAYDSAYATFSTVAPVILAKLASRLPPVEYRAVRAFFANGVQQRVAKIHEELIVLYK